MVSRGREGGTRRIVVGVDGSEGAQAALRWAAGEARLGPSRVRVITAWSYPLSPGYAGVPKDAFSEAATRTLAEATKQVAGLLPDSQIETQVVEASPARALIEASKDADLLVVGSRGRGGFKGLLLGSVSLHCAHHAHCPVAIVR